MKNTINFQALTEYAKSFSGLTDQHEAVLASVKNEIFQRIPHITDAFYAKLITIEKTKPFLEGKIESLKKTHSKWLESLFSSAFDSHYTEAMYKVGDVHVKINLPVEFMAGSMTLLSNLIISEIETLTLDSTKKAELTNAVISAIGFCLLIMQQSYQTSFLQRELEPFLKMTGISETLFSNLSSAYTPSN